MVIHGLVRETAIMAKAPEELTTTAMTTATWRVGSVFILNTNLCPDVAAKGEIASKIAKSVLEKGACAREGNQGQCSQPKLLQWHLHGSWVWAHNLVVRK